MEQRDAIVRMLALLFRLRAKQKMRLHSDFNMNDARNNISV
jgi:hypothetical protein